MNEPTPGGLLAPGQSATGAPSFADALAPVVVLITLIALTIALFGVAATDGPLQVTFAAERGVRRPSST